MAFFSLSQLDTKFRHGHVVVRVSRMWEFRERIDEGELRHVDMVLLDAEGSAMYAEISAKDAPLKQPLLTEGKVYTLKRFKVTNSKTSYRPVDARFMIYITYHTLIEEKSDVPSTFPMYTYRLTRFPDLPRFIGEVQNFLDIMGLVTDISEIENFESQNRSSRRRVVTLKDPSNCETKVQIWGNRAMEFEIDNVIDLSNEGPVVMIIVGLLAKNFKGAMTINGGPACRWYVKPNVPEVDHFLKRLGKDPKPINRVMMTSAGPVRRVYVEPELKQLVEVKALGPYDFPPQGFKVSVVLSRFDETQGWWFPSCNNCSKTCTKDGSGYRCPHDQCTGYKFKYKPCYFATDGTAEAEIVFFAAIGQALTGRDVKSLMKAYPNPGDIPPELASQVGQRFELTINVTAKAFSSDVYSYEVKKINHIYGRQPIIPSLQGPLTATSDDHEEPLATQASPPAAQAKQGDEEDKSSESLQTVTPLKQDAPPAEGTPVTPPLDVASGEASDLSKDVPLDKDAHATATKRVRRRLLTSDETADKDELGSSLEQILDDDSTDDGSKDDQPGADAKSVSKAIGKQAPSKKSKKK